MIILTIKQLKRRVIQGLAEPELFYMPWGKKEENNGTLVVNTFFYDYYDMNISEFVGKGDPCYTQIVIKRIKDNQILYCDKYFSALATVHTINSIPYGEYSVRVIRSRYGALLDNKEHYIKIDKDKTEYDIYLGWIMLKVEQYFDNEQLPYRVENNKDNLVEINNVNYRGGVKYKFFDLDNQTLLHTDEYLYNRTQDYFSNFEDSIFHGNVHYRAGWWQDVNCVWGA